MKTLFALLVAGRLWKEGDLAQKFLVSVVAVVALVVCAAAIVNAVRSRKKASDK